MKFMKKGSITVEAAIVLPFFICVVMTVISIAKVVYVHEIIQYTITETADELASTAYLFRVTGLQDLNNSINTGIEEKASLFENQIQGFSNLGEIFDTGETVLSNPLSELKSIAAYLAKGKFGDLKTELMIPMIKLYFQKNLNTSISSDLDRKLGALNIENGFLGLDFSNSEFLNDKTENIEIIVKYTIKLPVPIKILPKLVFVQRASARAWLGGDEATSVIDGNESIWSQDNFTRGKLIRSRFGANLPSNFPVIARFHEGKAVMIKSIDPMAESYQSPEKLKETLEEYISSLSAYKGQEDPWGSKKIIIRQNDIIQKELLLVIPENDLAPQTLQILEQYKMKSMALGIEFVIEKYGKKNMDGSDYNNENNTK